MDELLEQARSIYEGEIVLLPSLHSYPMTTPTTPPPFYTLASQLTHFTQDFHGQSLAETLSTALLSLSGVLAFIVGFLTQNIWQTLYVGLGGTALTFLVVVPPWPFFNQHPLPWLPARTGRGALAGSITVEGS